MKDKGQLPEHRTIHPKVLDELTLGEVAAMISVRDDLLSGAIKPREFNMYVVSGQRQCGTVMCIGGHVANRVGCRFPEEQYIWFKRKVRGGIGQLAQLFSPCNPSDPQRAAAAIDHYLETGKGTWPE